MDTKQLWDLFSGVIGYFFLVSAGAYVVTEAIKKLKNPKLKKFIPVFPPLLGLIGMLLIMLPTLPNDLVNMFQWGVTYGCIGLLAGSFSSYSYDMIFDKFFQKKEDPKDVKVNEENKDEYVDS